MYIKAFVKADESFQAANEQKQYKETHKADMYSEREYWKPNLNQREWDILNKELNRQVGTSDKFLDDATKWLYASEKGTTVFAIYGIGDGTEPTPLYATGGKKAITDYSYFVDIMEGYNNGSDRGRAAFARRIETVLAKQRRDYSHLYDATGGISADSNAGVYVSQRKRNGTGYPGSGKGNSGTGVKKSERDPSAAVSSLQERQEESVSNRSLLANALESAAQNDLERKRLQEYKAKIETMNAEEETLNQLNAQIRELSFASGPRDTKKIRELRDKAIKVSNRLTIYDNQLLRLEASAPLRSIVERSKKKAYEKARQKGQEALADYMKRAEQKQEEIKQRYQESRKKGIESRNKTAMRHKIKDVVSELSQPWRQLPHSYTSSAWL